MRLFSQPQLLKDRLVNLDIPCIKVKIIKDNPANSIEVTIRIFVSGTSPLPKVDIVLDNVSNPPNKAKINPENIPKIATNSVYICPFVLDTSFKVFLYLQ